MENKELQSLVTTADALVKRLHDIAEDPRYLAVWTFWAQHGMQYNGPFYIDELASLERALTHFKNDTSTGTDNK